MNRRITSLVAFVTCFLAPMIAMAAPAAGGPSGGPNDGIFAIAMGFGMGLAFIESLTILTLVTAFLIYGKLGA